MSAAAIRAVVFDLDGLMFNTEDLYEDVGGEIHRPRWRRHLRKCQSGLMGVTP